MALTRVVAAGIDTGGNYAFENINVAGVVTATSFVGDISQATGAAAGLGTALSQDQSNPLNKIYYTDTVLSIGSTQTVNPPDSSNVAYTQYAEIAVEEGYDLIVEDGDDLVPDILGLSTETAGLLSGAGGRVRADNFTNKAGTGAPTFPNGVNVTGVATATTFSGNLTGNVTGNVTGDVTGNLTGTASTATAATTAYGISGSPILTGISSVSTTNLTVNGNAYPSAGPLSNRNLVINGDMRIAQRGTSQSGLTDSPAYLVDRFAYRRTGSWGTNSFTMSQQSSGAPDGFRHFLRLAQSGTAAAPPTNTFCALATYLEGTTVYQAGFGTSAAHPLTLSFYARASQTGTYCVKLSNGSGQSFIAEYSVTSSWQKFIVNIPARTVGTWATNTDGSFFIEWIVAADSDGTFSGSTGWTATDNRFTTNQIETFASTSGATFDLTGVQLEVGTVATPFEHRMYSDELIRCQRYYQGMDTRTESAAYHGFGTSHFTSDTTAFGIMPFATHMRVRPTSIDASAANTFFLIGITNFTSIVIDQASRTSGVVLFSGGSGGWTNYRSERWLANSNNTAYCFFNAEI